MRPPKFLSRIYIGLCLGAAIGLCPALGATQTLPASHTRTLPQKTAPIKIVNAAYTPSGYPVPRFVSLKYGDVNGRTGPSTQHSIAWNYRRKGLPVIVVAETQLWRKIRDMNGDESWVRKVALAGERYAVTTMQTPVYAKPHTDAAQRAHVSKNVLLRLGECVETAWCKVILPDNRKAWAPARTLWGTRITP